MRTVRVLNQKLTFRQVMYQILNITEEKAGNRC
jgi:hypothetical protein